MPKKAELSDEDKALRERLGMAIRLASAQKGLKPKDLAAAAGVSLAHQYRVEAGEQTADVLYLVKVAALIGVSVESLLAGPAEGNTEKKANSPAPSKSAGISASSFSQSSTHKGSVQVGIAGGNVTIHPSNKK